MKVTLLRLHIETILQESFKNTTDVDLMPYLGLREDQNIVKTDKNEYMHKFSKHIIN